MVEMKILEGKVAVITGASRGLGKSMAQTFARNGARVVLAARSTTEIAKNAADLKTEGFEAEAFACDVSDLKQVEALALFTIEKFGKFDIWINNAGIGGPYGGTLDLSSDDFVEVLHTNINGTYFGSLVAMRHFLTRQTGKLVNILGQGAKKPVPNQNAYGSTKSWIRVFTLALAREYKHSGVGVFTLQPGLMDTDLLTDLVTFQEHEKQLRMIMPMLIRAGAKDPEVIAKKALWLVSPATDGKTGFEVNVGSPLALLPGFLREGASKLMHLPVRQVEMKVKIIPSAFEPLPGSTTKIVK